MIDATLYISNLPVSATEEELSVKFGRYGTVVSAKIAVDPASHRSKGFAFIEMGSGAQALAAVRGLNLTTYDGRLMSVNPARSDEDGMHHAGTSRRG